MDSQPSRTGPTRAQSEAGKLSPAEMAGHSKDAAQFLKLMANPNRLMVLCYLLEGEMPVGKINSYLPISQSALSQHLAVLRNSGLVTTRRDQQTIYYRLASREVEEIMEILYAHFCEQK